MGLFDGDFLTRCQRLAFAARTRFGGRLLGQRPRGQLAGGTEVTGYSDYTAGDDLRYVDWNRCARLDELVVRQFRGDEDLCAYVLVDCSASMRLGRKFDYARQLAGALAYVGLANLVRVGVAAFAGDLLSEVPPRRGVMHVRGIWRMLDSLTPRRSETNLQQTARSLASRHPRPGLAMVISDLYDPRGFRRGLDILRRCEFQLHVVQMIEPEEADPGWLGEVELVHLEPAGSQHVVMDQRRAARYRRLFEEYCRSVRRYCHDYGFGCTQTSTDLPFDRRIFHMMQSACS